MKRSRFNEEQIVAILKAAMRAALERAGVEFTNGGRKVLVR